MSAMSTTRHLSRTAAVTSILLATDLSCRSDRALDRALLLARQWGARLVIVTVIDSARTGHADLRPREANKREAERRVRSDAACDNVKIDVRVESGDLVSCLLAVAAQEGCEMIVVGVARHEGMGRMILGSTIDALLRRSPFPVLAVRQRARRPYANLVVASDFSGASKLALEWSGGLFPDASLLIFHALPSGPLLAAADGRPLEKDARLQQAQRQADALLAGASLPAAFRQQARFIFREGDAGLLLEAHGQDHCDDLVVLGTHARHRLVNLLIGSVAQRILERAENDVLSVPEPPAVEA
jgi:nucleotide-binding universal stress UspA family protein